MDVNRIYWSTKSENQIRNVIYLPWFVTINCYYIFYNLTTYSLKVYHNKYYNYCGS